MPRKVERNALKELKVYQNKNSVQQMLFESISIVGFLNIHKCFGANLALTRKESEHIIFF